jgi:hypothetical protein
LPGNEKRQMARMGIGRATTRAHERFGSPATARDARLSAAQVPQRGLFERTREGSGVLFVPPELVARLGWRDGGRMYFTEIGRTDVRAVGPALLVEVE